MKGLETSGSDSIWTLKKAFDKLYKRLFRKPPPSGYREALVRVQRWALQSVVCGSAASIPEAC